MVIPFGELWHKFVLFLPTLGTSVLIFIAFWVGARIAVSLLEGFGHRSRMNQDVLTLGLQACRLVILAFGVVTALGTLGVDVSALVAGLGLTGFALGFALKDVLSNTLSGVMILIFHPFRRSDYISVSGVEGHVAQIDLRYTVLDTPEKRILIPNTSIFTNIVTITKQPGQMPQNG